MRIKNRIYPVGTWLIILGVLVALIFLLSGCSNITTTAFKTTDDGVKILSEKNTTTKEVISCLISACKENEEYYGVGTNCELYKDYGVNRCWCKRIKMIPVAGNGYEEEITLDKIFNLNQEITDKCNQ
jgi:hypothetical protein